MGISISELVVVSGEDVNREHAMPAVMRRIGEVVGALKASDNKEQFRYKMDRLNRKSRLQMDMFFEI